VRGELTQALQRLQGELLERLDRAVEGRRLYEAAALLSCLTAMEERGRPGLGRFLQNLQEWVAPDFFERIRLVIRGLAIDAQPDLAEYAGDTAIWAKLQENYL